MIFNSLEFGAFFVVVFLVLAATNLKIFAKTPTRIEKTSAFRRIFLLIASYVFVGRYDWRFAATLFAVTLVAYFTTVNIAAKNRPRLNLRIGVVVPLVALAVFKYYNFFLSSFASVLGVEPEKLGTLRLILPIGISFYVFQAISYVVDVWKEKTPPARNFLDAALYMAFFPRLVAGPITRAGYFLPQLAENRNVGWKPLEIGVQIFAFGLFKKVVIADRLCAFVDHIYATPLAYDGATVTLAVFTYALQLYFDFSGYSDMAIGSAKMLGYDLPQNFNLPYLSRNPSEFWKRWHISLSSWLMDYLYIPLGGNRKGVARSYANLLITMLLGGLWHGANWAFVVWGGLHGLALCVHKYFKSVLKKRGLEKPAGASGSVLGTAVSILGTFAFASLCWIPFRANDFHLAATIFKRMFVWNDGVFSWYVWTYIFGAFLLVASGIAFGRYWKKLKTASNEERPALVKAGVQSFHPIFDLTTIRGLTAFTILIYAILCFAYLGNNPFVYAQF